MDKVRRKEVIGYVIVGLVIVVVGYVVYTILGANEPDRRYRNIEKIRGELIAPERPVEVAGLRLAEATRRV